MCLEGTSSHRTICAVLCVFFFFVVVPSSVCMCVYVCVRVCVCASQYGCVCFLAA